MCKKHDQKIGRVAASKQSLHPAYEGLAEHSPHRFLYFRVISGFNMKLGAEHLVV